jgi:general L-amino acid transport system permease protein
VAASDTATERAAIGPPPATTGFVGWLRRNLFSNIWNTLLTILCAYLLIRIVPPAVSWLFLDATWGQATPQQCRAGEGACWAFVREKHRVILFGRYPFAEHWRPLLGMIVLVTMVMVSCFRRFWKPWIALIWVGGLGAFFVLMWGGDIPVGFRAFAILGRSLPL